MFLPQQHAASRLEHGHPTALAGRTGAGGGGGGRGALGRAARAALEAGRFARSLG